LERSDSIVGSRFNGFSTEWVYFDGMTSAIIVLLLWETCIETRQPCVVLNMALEVLTVVVFVIAAIA